MSTEEDGAADRVRVTIESLAAGGDGVARMADGRVLFVPFSAPGDQVRVRIVRSKARFARGEVEALLEPGAARNEPLCPAFGLCGGCAWQHIGYAAQLQAKAVILRDAIERIGKLELGATPSIEPSPKPYHYRSRARVLARNGQVGFRRRHSHELCAVAGCPVLAEPVEKALIDWGGEGSGEFEEWELSLCEDGSVRRAQLSPRGGAGAGATPARPIRMVVDGASLRVSPGVFAQANGDLCEALVAAVCRAVEVAGRNHDAEILELFAGAGFFTLSLARRFTRVTAIESSRRAAEDLHANLTEQGLVHVEVICSRVEDAWSKLTGHTPAVVVLDPPRSGLGETSAAEISGLRAKRIVYLSCDPATLARDIRTLCAAGYELESLAGFDLFPQTPHVEALAVLDLVAEP